MNLVLQKQMLMQRAKNRFTKIYNLPGRTIEDGFQIMEIKDKKYLLFYYDDDIGSTHIEKMDLNN